GIPEFEDETSLAALERIARRKQYDVQRSRLHALQFLELRAFTPAAGGQEQQQQYCRDECSHQCVPDDAVGSSKMLSDGFTPRMIVPASSASGFRSRNTGRCLSSYSYSQRSGSTVPLGRTATIFVPSAARS